MTVSEFSKAINISKATVRRWIKEKKVNFNLLNGVICVPKEEVKRFKSVFKEESNIISKSLSVKDFCSQLGISNGTYLRLLNNGNITSKFIRGKSYIPLSDFYKIKEKRDKEEIAKQTKKIKSTQKVIAPIFDLNVFFKDYANKNLNFNLKIGTATFFFQTEDKLKNFINNYYFKGKWKIGFFGLKSGDAYINGTKLIKK